MKQLFSPRATGISGLLYLTEKRQDEPSGALAFSPEVTSSLRGRRRNSETKGSKTEVSGEDWGEFVGIYEVEVMEKERQKST